MTAIGHQPNQAFKFRPGLPKGMFYVKESGYITVLRELCKHLKIEDKFILEFRLCYIDVKVIKEIHGIEHLDDHHILIEYRSKNEADVLELKRCLDNHGVVKKIGDDYVYYLERDVIAKLLLARFCEILRKVFKELLSDKPGSPQPTTTPSTNLLESSASVTDTSVLTNVSLPATGTVEPVGSDKSNTEEKSLALSMSLTPVKAEATIKQTKNKQADNKYHNAENYLELHQLAGEGRYNRRIVDEDFAVELYHINYYYPAFIMWNKLIPRHEALPDEKALSAITTFWTGDYGVRASLWSDYDKFDYGNFPDPDNLDRTFFSISDLETFIKTTQVIPWIAQHRSTESWSETFNFFDITLHEFVKIVLKAEIQNARGATEFSLAEDYFPNLVQVNLAPCTSAQQVVIDTLTRLGIKVPDSTPLVRMEIVGTKSKIENYYLHYFDFNEQQEEVLKQFPAAKFVIANGQRVLKIDNKFIEQIIENQLRTSPNTDSKEDAGSQNVAETFMQSSARPNLPLSGSQPHEQKDSTKSNVPHGEFQQLAALLLEEESDEKSESLVSKLNTDNPPTSVTPSSTVSNQSQYSSIKDKFIMVSSIGEKLKCKDVLRLRERNPKEAFRLFYKAAQLNSPEACFYLGEFFDFGTGTVRDVKQAIYWYQKAIELGNVPDAMLNLGIAYFEGTGIEKNEQKAEELLKKSADSGHPIGQYTYVGLKLNQQTKLSETDYLFFIDLLRSSLRGGHHQAETLLTQLESTLAQVYIDANAVDKAIRILENLTKSKDPRTQQNLANLFQNTIRGASGSSPNPLLQYLVGVFFKEGIGVAKDIPLAIFWLDLAAKNGVFQAKPLLYQLQKLVPIQICESLVTQPNPDEKYSQQQVSASPATENKSNNVSLAQSAESIANVQEAVILLNTAALQEYAFSVLLDAGVQNNQHAFFNLGLCYQQGVGTKINGKMAVVWYQKAVDAGDREAMVNLGAIYDNGMDNVAKDQKAAESLYKQAAERGDLQGQFNYARLLYNQWWLKEDKDENSIQPAVKLYEQVKANGIKDLADKAQICLVKINLIMGCMLGNTERQTNAINFLRGIQQTGSTEAKEDVLRLVEAFKKEAPQIPLAQTIYNILLANGIAVEKSNPLVLQHLNSTVANVPAETKDSVTPAEESMPDADAEELIKQALESEDATEKLGLLVQAATMGDPKANRLVGDCFWNGDGTDKDEVAAIHFYQTAIDLTSVAAIIDTLDPQVQYALGLHYVEKDKTRAIEFLRKAQANGIEAASKVLAELFSQDEKQTSSASVSTTQQTIVTTNLSNTPLSTLPINSTTNPSNDPIQTSSVPIYETKEKQKGSPENQFNETVSSYRKAIASGDVDAMFTLGVLYMTGNGVEQNLYEASRLHKQAADKGHLGAQFNYASAQFSIWQIEKSTDAEKLIEIIGLFKKLIDRNHPSAEGFLKKAAMELVILAHRLLKANSADANVIRLLLKAADENCPHAYFLLGQCFNDGHGGAEKNIKNAIFWYDKAQKAGLVEAMVNLGVIYASSGLEKDDKAAEELYKQAAEKGSPEGQYNYLVMLLKRAYALYNQWWLREDKDENTIQPAAKLYEQVISSGIKDLADEAQIQLVKINLIMGCILGNTERQTKAITFLQALQQTGSMDAKSEVLRLVDAFKKEAPQNQLAQSIYNILFKNGIRVEQPNPLASQQSHNSAATVYSETKSSAIPAEENMPSEDEIMAWVMEASTGNPEANCRLGNHFWIIGDKESAKNYYQAAIEADLDSSIINTLSPEVQYAMGMHYLEQKNQSKAIKLLTMAQKNGIREAASALAGLLPQDEKQTTSVSASTTQPSTLPISSTTSPSNDPIQTTSVLTEETKDSREKTLSTTDSTNLASSHSVSAQTPTQTGIVVLKSVASTSLPSAVSPITTTTVAHPPASVIDVRPSPLALLPSDFLGIKAKKSDTIPDSISLSSHVLATETNDASALSMQEVATIGMNIARDRSPSPKPSG